MPVVSNRRLRVTAPLVGVVLAVGLLAGCAGQRAPGSYGDGVENSFVKGCWTTLVSDANGDDARDSDGNVLSADDLEAKFASAAKTAQQQCGCAYDALKKDVKFSTFKQVNDDQTEEPGTLPSSFTKAYASCGIGDSSEG